MGAVCAAVLGCGELRDEAGAARVCAGVGAEEGAEGWVARVAVVVVVLVVGAGAGTAAGAGAGAGAVEA